MRQPAAGGEAGSTGGGSTGGRTQQTQGKSPKGKSSPRKPNYNPTIGHESKTGKKERCIMHLADFHSLILRLSLHLCLLMKT